MKLKIVVAGFVLALQLALAFVPVVPWFAAYFPPAMDVRTQVARTIWIASVQFSIMTALIAWLLILGQANAGSIAEQVARAISRSPAERIRDDDFYSSFLRAVERARQFIYVSYFAPYPPADIPGKPRAEYYKALHKAVAARTYVSFRRLVRATARNRPWIRELIGAMQGKQNFNLGALEDSAEREASLALSVQVIDDSQSWLVAVKSHERQGVYRDTFIDDPVISIELALYHNRLWEQSLHLVENGRVTEAGEAYLKD